VKPDERAFLLKLLAERPRQLAQGPYATDVGVSLGIHEKRALYLLRKWTGKSWWNWGVSLRGGWLTAKGIRVAQALTSHPSGG
jgi:hypothetical protein